MSEIKVGSIVDVKDSSYSMIIEDSVLTKRKEALRNRNPWKVLAVNGRYPMEECGRRYYGFNTTMITPLSGNGIVAFTRTKYLKLHIDENQEMIMENQKKSLEKWEKGVVGICSLLSSLNSRCGYCENISFIMCNKNCSLYKKKLCSGDMEDNTPFNKVIRALKEATKNAVILRDGIREDIGGAK